MIIVLISHNCGFERWTCRSNLSPICRPGKYSTEQDRISRTVYILHALDIPHTKTDCRHFTAETRALKNHEVNYIKLNISRSNTMISFVPLTNFYLSLKSVLYNNIIPWKDYVWCHGFNVGHYTYCIFNYFMHNITVVIKVKFRLWAIFPEFHIDVKSHTGVFYALSSLSVIISKKHLQDNFKHNSCFLFSCCAY